MTNLEGKKILIIDDSETDHYIIAKFLADSGALLYPAYTGADGIAVAKEIDPHLVILDKMLPDMSPQAVIAAIRPVPILLYTAQLINEDWHALQQAGATELLIKHMPAHAFINKISVYLQ
jgi:CheY-like chemotaxis protein